MKNIAIKLPAMSLLIAVIFAAGCAVFGGDDEAQWRELTVMGVQSRATLDPSVDISCLKSVAPGSNEAVAVVRFRVNRAQYLQAFIIPKDRRLNVGDPVVVHPIQCILKDDSTPS